MTSRPIIEYREEQPYVAVPASVPMQKVPEVVPDLFGEIFRWTGEKGIEGGGPAFIRYLSMDSECNLELEVGIPTIGPVEGDGRVRPGVFPAGRYAVLLHTGPYSGLPSAHGAMIDWGRETGVSWQESKNEGGEQWGSRTEFYPTDPNEEPDSSKWVTEIAFLIADS